MERLLIDTDIGSDVDDAHAVLYALKASTLSLEGITTVYGRTDVRAKLAKKLVDYVGRPDIPVAAGRGEPFVRGPHGIWHTGKEGEGVLTPAEYDLPLSEMGIREDAVDFLIERIMSQPGEYNLVTIGALTNVAAAFEREPRLSKNVKRMYLMAGKIPRAPFGLDDEVDDGSPEHNVACDIRAAQIVFSTSVPKTVLPFNVTALVPIRRERFEKLRTGHPADEALYALTKVWFDYRDSLFGRRVGFTCMHDPLTVAAIDHPELLQTAEMRLSVDDYGHLKVGDDGVPATVCYDVNSDRFEDIFLQTMVRRPQQLADAQLLYRR